MVLLDRLMHTYSGIQEIIRILWDRVVQSASCLCPGPGETSPRRQLDSFMQHYAVWVAQ